MTGRRTPRALATLVAAALATVVLVAVPTAPAAATPGPPPAPQWWFDDWGVPALWADGARGEGITIAEIDSGVNADLPELAGKILPGKDFGDPSMDGRHDHMIDPFGHGTAMASLMVAEPTYLTGNITGLAPDARVLPIAVPLADTDDAAQQTGTEVGSGVRWAADQGAQVISMSLGSERDPNYDVIPCPPDTQSAISYAISKGAIVVAASGNEGENGSPVTEPGVCIGVVSVGAVNSSDQVASFSSRHPYLTMSAPGVNIATLGRVPGEVYIGDGTSQATALTSAVFAMVWSKYPELTNSQVIARVLATLKNKTDSPAPDPGFGFGIVDAGEAIRTDVPLDAPNPLTTAMQPFADAAAAQAPQLEDPAPAATGPKLPGELVIGARPSLVTAPMLGAAGLALAGLLGLVLLTFVGIRRRRAYVAAVRAQPSPPITLPPYTPFEACAGPSPPNPPPWG